MTDYVTKVEFNDFRKEMSDFKAEMYEFRMEMRAEFAAFKQEMRTMLFEALQAQTEMLKSYIDGKIEEVKAEMRRDRHYMDLFIQKTEQNERENMSEHGSFSRRLKALEA